MRDISKRGEGEPDSKLLKALIIAAAAPESSARLIQSLVAMPLVVIGNPAEGRN